MKKNEIMVVLGLIAVFSMSYLHFRPNVAAQTGTETDLPALKERVQTFFGTLNTQSIDSYQKAYQSITDGSQTQENDILEMAKMTDEMITLITRSSSRCSYEFLDNKPVGNDLILMRYLYKSDTHPVIWYFTFYRSQTVARPSDPKAKWNCIGIRFDTDIDSLYKGNWSK